uniref:Uncharacterized protein n=1 Tax=Octopus bimaculoides TaxID=37653 RepID=A0A0L8FI72_OCTBM
MIYYNSKVFAEKRNFAYVPFYNKNPQTLNKPRMCVSILIFWRYDNKYYTDLITFISTLGRHEKDKMTWETVQAPSTSFTDMCTCKINDVV